MRYLLLVISLIGFNASACSQECSALNNISFSDRNLSQIYGELQSETLGIKGGVKLPVPKINGISFAVDDTSNSAISFISGSHVKNSCD